MTGFTDVPFPDVGRRKDGHPADPQIPRRASVCGQLDHQEQWHSPIAVDPFKEHSRAENCPVDIKARCLDCAIEVEDRDDKDQMVRPQKTLDSYQAGTSFTYARKTGTTPQGEFDDVLETHKCSRHRGTVTKPHSTVFEEEHRVHRLEVKAETGVGSDKWLAIPTGRACDTTRHTTGRAELGIYQRSVFPFSRKEDCHPTADTPGSFARESAFIEHLIAEYASLIDSGLDPDVVDTRYERPRAVPAVPKGHSRDSVKQRSRISTGALTRSEPVSRNFRRLRLNIQNSARPIHRTQSGQESPDWACRTSLAIEYGTISMGSVCMHKRDSTSRHISEAMRSPTETCLLDRRRVQSFGPGEKGANYSVPSSKHGLTQPAANRHSEGALQLVRGANATRLVGKPEGMEVTIGREPLGHNYV